MSIFDPLNRIIGRPLVEVGGADGQVLFNKQSTSQISPTIQVGLSPYVVKAYGLKDGETLSVLNVCAGYSRSDAYTHAGEPVILDSANSTVVLFLSGSYKLQFSGVLGDLVVTATELTVPRVANQFTGYSLRSLVAMPNPLLEAELLSPHVQISTQPWVFRAYGLTGGKTISVLNVFTDKGVDTVEPYTRVGGTVAFTETNNTIVLDTAGTYQFQLSEYDSSVLLVGNESVIQFVDPYNVEAADAAAQSAASSASAAAASAVASSNSATVADGSATAAAGSATAAATSASDAADSATAADGSATAAAGSVTNAASSVTAAGVSASSAATSASSAATSASSAASSAASVPQIRTTVGVPAAGFGNNGDYAIDQTAKLIYGPKAAGAWPAGVSLGGAKGDKGDRGDKGDTGLTGNSLNQTYATVNSVAGVLPVIDMSLGNEIIKTTLFENITAAPTFSNPPAVGKEATIRWDVTQATGGTQYTVANPAPGKTAGGAWVNSMTSGAKESVLLVIDSTGAIVKAFPMGVLA